jgi:hypothetical protein
VFAEFCDLFKKKKLAYERSTWIAGGLAGTASAYLRLDFVYLCRELGVSWSTLDPRELCGISHVVSICHA